MTQSRDSYREVQLVEPHDTYRRDILLKNPTINRSEALAAEHCDYSKQDGLVEHHEYQPVNLETGHQDAVNHYRDALYHEHLSYHDTVYPTGRHPNYNPPADRRPEYHFGGLSMEYSSTRVIAPDYHSSANSQPEFHYHHPVHRY